MLLPTVTQPTTQTNVAQPCISVTILYLATCGGFDADMNFINNMKSNKHGLTRILSTASNDIPKIIIIIKIHRKFARPALRFVQKYARSELRFVQKYARSAFLHSLSVPFMQTLAQRSLHANTRSLRSTKKRKKYGQFARSALPFVQKYARPVFSFM